MSTDVVLAESTGVQNPFVLIQAWIEKGGDAGQLEKLLDLEDRWERNRAAREFSQALSRFQKLCPPIKKDRDAKGGKIAFKFASYDDVMRIAQPHLSDCNLAVSFNCPTCENKEGQSFLTMECRLRCGIHYEDKRLTLPVPVGIVNNTQLYGQALSYLKRYLLCLACNIVVTDEDQDATDMYEWIDKEQLATINGILEAKKVNVEAFLVWVQSWAPQATTVKEIPQSGYEKVIDILKRK